MHFLIGSNHGTLYPFTCFHKLSKDTVIKILITNNRIKHAHTDFLKQQGQKENMADKRVHDPEGDSDSDDDTDNNNRVQRMKS